MIIRRDLRKKGLASKLIEALLGALTQATLIFPPDQARMINLSKDLGF